MLVRQHLWLCMSRDKGYAYMLKDEVIEFISRRFSEKNDHWTDGNCYYFALILCSRFSELSICYLPVRGHFVAGYGGEFFDANGVVDVGDEDVISFMNLYYEDKLLWERLYRYCIK